MTPAEVDGCRSFENRVNAVRSADYPGELRITERSAVPDKNRLRVAITLLYFYSIVL